MTDVLKVKRPIVRYHGGKWKLAPWILDHMPKHRVYVEPYGGGASILLRKTRSYAEIYNDLDGEVVNLFRAARDHGYDLRNRLRLTPFAREEFVLSYQPADCPIEAARRMVVRSFMGYGSNAVLGKPSGFRANSNRSGNTPAADWKNYGEAFTALVERLRGVVIENRDAQQVMAVHDSPETLHYVDPPYVKSTRDNGKDYRHEMTDSDHLELAEFLAGLSGMVMVSGYRCALYDTAFRGWRRLDKAAMADGARKRTESLWLSPNIAGGLFA